MTIVRLPLYAAAVLLVLLCGYGLGVLGLTLCSPPPLPGDAAWTWTTRLSEALGIVFGQETRCFLRVAAGRWSLGLAAWSGTAALMLAALAVLWEVVGRQAYREFRVKRGGHAILAGEPGEIEILAKAARRTPTIFVVRSRAAAMALGRARPFADLAVLADRRHARQLLRRLGGPRSRFIAAATANDLTNGELAEAALEAGGKGELLVRLESASVRALKSDLLRRSAEREKRGLAVVSLRQIEARLAMYLAMPGRFRDASRIHIAVCGEGPMMQEIAFLVAQQGYGLDSASPLLSLLRTGRGDFAAGALEQLATAKLIAVQAATASGDDPVAIDRAFAAMALAATPLAAVHCCEDGEGGALALALRLERVFVDLELPVPPIVVHGGGSERPGDTGMVRVAEPLNLAEARDYAVRIDDRARAFHAAYLAGQRVARGAQFGTLPAERDWSVLPEQFRDDNRNAADHIDYKLARAGLVAGKHPEGAKLTAADVETLAGLEHGRWMARRSLAGWRHGVVRDDRLLLHPDLKPYESLDEDARRKDREQVSLVPGQLSAGGETLARLQAFALLSATGVERAIALLGARSRKDPAWQPLVAVALENADALAVAEAALAARLPVEALVTGAPEHFFADQPSRRRAAAILRQAWRIQIVRGRPAVEALAARCPVLVDGRGRLHETVLP